MPIEVTNSNNYYRCEHCSYTNPVKSVVESHEKKHNIESCDHKKFYIYLDAGYLHESYYYQFNFRCEKCLFEDRAGLDALDQEMLLRVFNAIKASN